MKEEYIFVGDIHGEVNHLKSLLRILPKTMKLVFVGDYVNYGPSTNDVIDLLIEVSIERPETVFLKGNHEYYLEQYLNQKMAFYDFCMFGGISTIQSYMIGPIIGDVAFSFRNAIPVSHIEFLKNLSLSLETEDIVVSHSGINTLRPDSRSESDLLFNKNLIGQGSSIDKTIICGHFPQKNYKPFISEGLICVDTGCGTLSGPLSAVSYPNLKIFNSH